MKQKERKIGWSKQTTFSHMHQIHMHFGQDILLQDQPLSVLKEKEITFYK